MNEELYHLVEAVANKTEHLDTESSLLLKKLHKEYIRNGMKLPVGLQRDRFREIQQRLSELRIEFRKNQSKKGVSMWFSPEDVKGMPDDLVSGLDRGTEENEGKLRLTVDFRYLLPALMYAQKPQTRKSLQLAYENKCIENVPIFKEVMLLRDEAARLIEYPNHATFRLEEKMAKTPERVNIFLADLRSRLTAGGRTELEGLKQLKKIDMESRGEVFDGRFYIWDKQFYGQIMLEKDYSVDQQKISEYFLLQTTLKGMLGIFEHLFGLVFEEIDSEGRCKLSASGNGDYLVWHADVQLFSVRDSEDLGSGFVGYMYFDLYARDNKYSNPSNWNLQPVCSFESMHF